MSDERSLDQPLTARRASAEADASAQTLRDTVSLSELASSWTLSTPTAIAESLAAALTTMLPLEFVYIRAPGRRDHELVEVAHRKRGPVQRSKAELVGSLLEPWIDSAPSRASQPMVHPLGAGMVYPVIIRVHAGGTSGVLGAASARQGFPAAHERQLLQVAGGYLGIALDRNALRASLREADTRFRNFADSAPVMIWLSDPEGRSTFQSDSWHRFTGQPEGSALGDGWLAAVHPQDRPRIQRQWEQATGAREDTREEYRLRRADGEYRWVLDSASPRFGDRQEFLGYIGSIIDITARKRSEELLAESERRYAMVTELVPQLIWICDAEGRPVYFNKRWYEFTGMAPGAVEIVTSVTHADDRPRVIAAWAQAVKDGRAFETEYRLRRHDGGYEWFLAQGLPEYDGKGNIVKWYGSCTNIDAQRRARDRGAPA